MNPFADATAFERLRRAALEGGDRFASLSRTLSAPARSRNILRFPERMTRMLLLAVSSSPASLLVGPPGTGKTELLYQTIEMLNKQAARFGFSRSDLSAEAVTPEEDWGYGHLVLGETLQGGSVVSKEGVLLRAIRDDVWLLLDEMNRADMDRIFGGLLTWLSGNRVKIGTWSSADQGVPPYPVYLSWSDSNDRSSVVDTPGHSREYIAGSDWRLLGTYNAVDAQRVYRMGQALSRRFKHIPVAPASVADFREIIGDYISEGENKEKFTDRVARLYEAHLTSANLALGPGVFVQIPAFLERGLDAYLEPDFTGGEMENLVDDLLAEGYFAAASSLVSRYTPEEVEKLASSFLASAAFSAANVEWIQTNLLTLQR